MDQAVVLARHKIVDDDVGGTEWSSRVSMIAVGTSYYSQILL